MLRIAGVMMFLDGAVIISIGLLGKDIAKRQMVRRVRFGLVLAGLSAWLYGYDLFVNNESMLITQIAIYGVITAFAMTVVWDTIMMPRTKEKSEGPWMPEEVDDVN